MNDFAKKLQNKCVHFNGIMNDCCEAGVKYADVRVGKPYKFPCMKMEGMNGGECAKATFLSDEEATAKAEVLGAELSKGLATFVNAKQHFEKTKQMTGTVKCECGGVFRYAVAESNKHMRGRCSSCGISFTE